MTTEMVFDPFLWLAMMSSYTGRVPEMACSFLRRRDSDQSDILWSRKGVTTYKLASTESLEISV